MVIKRRPIKKKNKKQQNLCLDKGYYSAEIEYEVIKRKYIPHIRKRGEKKKHGEKKKRRRRWMVERTNSWHNRFRKLLTRYEKKSDNYLGLVQLACCMIVYRRILLG
jgi:transposase